MAACFASLDRDSETGTEFYVVSACFPDLTFRPVWHGTSEADKDLVLDIVEEASTLDLEMDFDIDAVLDERKRAAARVRALRPTLAGIYARTPLDAIDMQEFVKAYLDGAVGDGNPMTRAEADAMIRAELVGKLRRPLRAREEIDMGNALITEWHRRLWPRDRSSTPHVVEHGVSHALVEAGTGQRVR